MGTAGHGNVAASRRRPAEAARVGTGHARGVHRRRMLQRVLQRGQRTIVSVRRTTPRPASVIVIAALGTTALLVSTTVPDSVAASCPRTAAGNDSNTAQRE